MTKTKLKWRLADRPTVSEIESLVEREIISKEEAREVLFSQEVEGERDKKGLESEIKFLRELVEKLSKSSSTIVEQIRYIQAPYVQYPWWQPYQLWCTNLAQANALGTIIGGSSATLASTTTAGQWNIGIGQSSTAHSAQSSFSSIKTF